MMHNNMLYQQNDTVTKMETNYDSIYAFINAYCNKYSLEYINVPELSKLVSRSLKLKISIYEVRKYISDYSAERSSHHPEYKKLASIMAVDNLACITNESMLQVISDLYNNLDRHGNKSQVISDELMDILQKHHEVIQNKLNFLRDYDLDYFGIKTLERSYLLKVKFFNHNGKIINVNKVVERPQHLFMRVALGIHGWNLEKAFKTYDLLSLRYMTHATPTLFNAGTPRPQMSSCFLFDMEDSLDEIMNTMHDVAIISKWSGGIGVSITDIRAKGSLIRGTNGDSNGIIPMCGVFNATTKYANQSGKRNGVAALYNEPWHADIFEFCELRKNTGNSDEKARDLFIAIWANDLFMKRVEQDDIWSLMCPDECPGLTTSYGKEFEELYIKYEQEGRYKRQVKAVELWNHILIAQIETGMPYLLFKDHANHKSNQKNLGTIKSSNLCTEIIEYTDKDNTAVCNLASICLQRCINNGKFDFDKLIDITKELVVNLNIVIDKNYYPTDKTRNSNLNTRPIGIGCQGLSNVYFELGYPFDSAEARLLNKQIFETIYFAAVSQSVELAKTFGPYPLYQGSPTSKGILQYDLWGLTERDLLMGYDWLGLKQQMAQYGIRNSLLTTVMPTATTATIMGSIEAAEPILSNVFTYSTLAGECLVINEQLVYELIKEGLWSDEMRKKIIISQGSIQKIKGIPERLKNIYKTAFELGNKPIITQGAERGPYICQSQSQNLFMETPNFDKLTSAHFYSFKMGCKTGMYYLRTRPAIDPLKFGFNPKDVKQLSSELEDEQPKFCRWRPGMSAADCASCQ